MADTTLVSKGSDIPAYVGTAGATSSLYLTPSSGNVGIGTTSVSQKLDVRSTSNTDGIAVNIYENTSVLKGRQKGSLFFKYENPGVYQNPVLQTGAEIRTVAGKNYDDAANGAGDTDLLFLTARRQSYSLNLEEKMRITHEGKVGIGTTDPDSSLNIYNGSSRATLQILGAGADNNYASIELGNVGVGTNSRKWGVGIRTDSPEYRLSFASYDGSSWYERFTVLSDGKVGIGTNSPSAPLDVSGTIRAISQTLSNPATGKGLELYYNAASDYGAIVSFDRSATNYKDLFLGCKNFKVLTNNVDSLVINEDHYVGIGTSNPSHKLEVLGNISIDNASALYFGDSTTDGTWRMIRSGNNLLVQRRESSTWNTKYTFSA